MTDKDVELRLKKAVEAQTPDVLDSVLKDCKNKNGKVMNMSESRRKNYWLRGAVAMAAAVALVLVGAFGYNWISKNDKNYVSDIDLAATVILDVNPSIEMQVSSNERVISVKPLNDDAKKIVDGMDFKGSDMKVAVNALIGSMVRHGYINELANSILISVDGNGTEKGKELENKLSNLSADVENMLKSDKFNGAVVCQSVSIFEAKELAEKYGISVGKAQFINRIIAADDRYSFEQLAPLSINELNLLRKSGEKADASVKVSGEASQKEYIGSEAAEKAALEALGVKKADVSELEVEMDYENGKMVYEVEFNYNGREYEYDISAVDGSVVQVANAPDDDYGNNGGKDQNDNAGAGQVIADGLIKQSRAKEIALGHAGVKASDARRIEIERDVENGIAVYEIEFKYDKYEYSYEINAKTGEIIHSEKELDD